MDTEQLIRSLAADNSHRARPVGYVLMLALLAAAPVSLLIFFAELGFRPDIMTAMRNPFFDLKFAVTLALAISAIAVALHLSRPEASLRGFGWYLLIPAGLLAAGVSGEMMMPQRMPMMTRLVGNNSRICMTAIPRCRCRCSLPRCSGCATARQRGRRCRARSPAFCRRDSRRRSMPRTAPTTRRCSSRPGTRSQLHSSPHSAR